MKTNKSTFNSVRHISEELCAALASFGIGIRPINREEDDSGRPMLNSDAPKWELYKL